MKKILILCLLTALLLCTVSCGDSSDGVTDLSEFLNIEETIDHVTIDGETFYFETTEVGSVAITAYKAKDEPHTVVIPAEISYTKGEETTVLKVTEIAQEAFSAVSSVKNIDFSKAVNLTVIHDYAFRDCRSLEALNIPATVKEVGKGAFYGCTALKTVAFSSAMTEIADNTFMDCTALTSVTIPGNIKTVGVGAFYGCESLSSVVISEGVTEIGAQAFEDCTNLSTLTLANSLSSIGDKAFNGSEKLYLEGVTYNEGNRVVKAYVDSLGLKSAQAE